MHFNFGIVVAGVVVVLASMSIHGGYSLADGWVRDLSPQNRQWFAIAMGMGGCAIVVYGLYCMKRDEEYVELILISGVLSYLVYATLAQVF